MPLALAGALAAAAGGVLSMVGDQIKYDPLFVWVPLGLIVFILWASAYFKPTALTAPIEWIGRNSIVFYAVHFPLLVVTARMIAPAQGWNGNLFYILLFLWAVAVGTVVQLLRSRFAPVAGLFDFRQVLKLLNIRSRAVPSPPPRQ